MASRKDHATRFFAIEKPDDYADKPEDEQKRIADAARQALKRARDTLFSKAIIGIDEEWIWLTGKPVQGFGPPPGVRKERKAAPADRRDEGPAKKDDLPFAEDDDFDPMGGM